MDDVEISGNVANDKNGKINMGNAILQNGTLELKENVQINGNIHLIKDKYITIDKELLYHMDKQSALNITTDEKNENEFRKKERAVKKYNMLAYKKLVFDFYPAFRDGNFMGVIVSKNTKDGITKYELKLPTDRMFAAVHGDVKLHYTVYENQKLVMLDTLTPEDILTEGHQKELSTYKGVMVSKSHADRDMFKINLLNMLDK